jgi:hypothetical protein
MSNWHVVPVGTPDQKAAVRIAADVVRLNHPYASDDVRAA